MSSTFAALGVPAELADVLARRGVTSPFPIQALTIPDALDGRDVCGRAPTGSGKTIAFGVPLAARVGRARPSRPRALVLAPTRELASQIVTELRPLAAACSRTVAPFYGGVGFGAQLAALRKGVDIAVACPGRLADLVGQQRISLADVDIVVIDEADRMADMGFLPEVRRLLDQVQRDRQTMLFSATLDGDVDVLIRRYQRHPVRHAVELDTTAVEATTHLFWRVSREQRVAGVADLVSRHGSTIVFCRTKRGADRLARQLGQAGVRAAAIHGDRSQGQRERALAAFSGGRADALVATDVAARGIHVDGVGCVVHFDPPADEKAYVHRSGRTARAGAPGVVVSLVTDEHVPAVKAMQRRLGMPVGIHPPARALRSDRERVDAAPTTRGQARRTVRTGAPSGARTTARTGARGSGPAGSRRHRRR